MKKKRYKKGDSVILNSENRLPFFRRRSVHLSVAFIIIFLMLGSVFIYWIGGSAGTTHYGNHDFFQSAQGWVTKIDDQQYTFASLPQDVATLPTVNFNLRSQSAFYLLFNASVFPEQSLELQRLRSLFLQDGKSVSLACLNDVDCGDLPVRDCHNPDRPALLLQQGNQTGLFVQEKCLVLQFNPGEYEQLFTHFAYKYYGVLA